MREYRKRVLSFATSTKHIKFNGLGEINIVIFCAIAVAYGTDYKTGLRVSVCVSVCEHSHGRIS